MEDRGFNEIALRRMLANGSGHRADLLAGRFIMEGWHGGKAWEVIVEPDDVRQLLVVITAYPAD